MIHYIEFQHDEDRYIAAGMHPESLAVYEITGGRNLEKTQMRYPSCLRFMYDVDLAFDPPRTMTREEWRQRFDLVLAVNG